MLAQEAYDQEEREYYVRLRDARTTLAKRCEDFNITEVKKDEKGTLRAVLKDTAVKDWQDPYHQECPMKW